VAVSLPVSIDDAIARTTARLYAVSDSARLDAELLIARAIDMPRSYLFAHPEDTLDCGALERLESTVGRRLAGEPMAYIHGFKEFWSLEIMVTPATLVPRPETEVLVELALREIPRRTEWEILDLGTGSGAIALAIAHDRPLCRITAVDVSADALAVARLNARQHKLCNIEFLPGDWTAPVAGRRFRIVVANPPYVRAGDPQLAALAAEPDIALASGPDGLEAIRTIARDSRSLLEDGGMLFLEHGAEQRDPVAEILAESGWASVRCYDDHAGLPRVSCALHHNSETT
jgi:release factor glutamine methyltransferase